MATRLARDRAAAWLFDELPSRVPAWLAAQRWYGGKTDTIVGVEVEDVIWLPVGDALAALVVLRITLDGGGARRVDRYATLLQVGDLPSGSAVIGDVDGEAVGDAAASAPAVLALLAGLGHGASLPGVRGGALRYADATPRVQRLFAAAAEPSVTVVPVGAEQSNTSTRLGADLVFKLFRRLEAGEHPQLEIGRFLAHRGFRGVPPLEGSITYALPEDGAACAIGALEGWIENEGDGWRDLVACLGRACRDGGTDDELMPRLAALGRTLAAFHQAMASDDSSADFAPEPVTADDLRAWQAALYAQYDRTLALVERHAERWDPTATAVARGLAGSRPGLAAIVEPLWVSATPGWSKIRVHGDFHLGQTLRTRDGYVVIDFEGEPSKPIAERRQRHSPLKDVAGMLRSLDYAAATIRTSGSPLTREPDTMPLRRAFVDAYRAHVPAGATFLPNTPAAFRAWLQFFELDKALYEVEYEANSRPSWVHIPLAAVAALLPPLPGGIGVGS